MALSFSKLHANLQLIRVARHSFDRAVSWPGRQVSTGQTRRLACSAALAAVVVLGAAACRSDTSSGSPTAAVSKSGVPRGGQLLVSVRSEPRSFNRHAARDTTTILVSNLTQGRLVRVNQATQAVEPWLAESWTTADEGRRDGSGVPGAGPDVVGHLIERG